MLEGIPKSRAEEEPEDPKLPEATNPILSRRALVFGGLVTALAGASNQVEAAPARSIRRIARVTQGAERFAGGHGLWKTLRQQLSAGGAVTLEGNVIENARADWSRYYEQPFEKKKLGEALDRRKEFPDHAEFFKEKGVSPDAIYLGIVESWFNDNLHSPAGAVGPFQFLKQTAMRPDIKLVIPENKEKKTPEIDNRKNFVESAKACAIYLASIQKRYQGPSEYDNLKLALSHYNGSFADRYRGEVGANKVTYPGFVSFMQGRMRERLINLEKDRPYEVKEKDTLEKIAASIGSTTAAIAKRSGIGSSPALKAGQKLTLPSVIAALKEREPEYVVPKGATLGGIAKQLKVPLGELRRINGMKPNESAIKIGQRLKVPHTPETERAREAQILALRIGSIKGLIENMDYALKWEAVVEAVKKADAKKAN